VLDSERPERVLQTLRAAAQPTVTRPVASDDGACAGQALHRVSGPSPQLTDAAENASRGADSNAKPPPLQNPTIPILPVQAVWAPSHRRAASMSS
jgi:hypothetical protein